jgi:hypothetical protein
MRPRPARRYRPVAAGTTKSSAPSGIRTTCDLRTPPQGTTRSARERGRWRGTRRDGACTERTTPDRTLVPSIERNRCVLRRNGAFAAQVVHPRDIRSERPPSRPGMSRTCSSPRRRGHQCTSWSTGGSAFSVDRIAVASPGRQGIDACALGACLGVGVLTRR